VNVVSAVFPEKFKPWEGGILTSVTTSFENLDSHGHGVKLEATAMLPSWCLTSFNWRTGLEYKLNALKFPHLNAFIAIVRDRDTGRIYPDPTDGGPRIMYTPSKFDRAHGIEGILALSRILYAQGAEEIHVSSTSVSPFIRHPSPTTTATDDDFNAWLATINITSNAPPRGFWTSAHQMGSNRMSTTPTTGVVDPQGQVWGTHGLYVADASVFPSASGVNPMVTNMAISDMISRGVAATLSSAATREGPRL
jgi:hypothetical protein